MPVGGKTHCSLVHIGIFRKQIFEFLPERMIGIDRVEKINHYRKNIIHSPVAYIAHINPSVLSMSWKQGFNSYLSVPQASVVRTYIADIHKTVQPRFKNFIGQSEYFCQILFGFPLLQVCVQTRKCAERSYFQQNKRGGQGFEYFDLKARIKSSSLRSSSSCILSSVDWCTSGLANKIESSIQNTLHAADITCDIAVRRAISIFSSSELINRRNSLSNL